MLDTPGFGSQNDPKGIRDAIRKHGGVIADAEVAARLPQEVSRAWS